MNFEEKPQYSAAVICNYIMKLNGRDAYQFGQPDLTLVACWRVMVEFISAESSTGYANIWKGIQRYSYSYLLEGTHWQTHLVHPAGGMA